MDDLSLLIKAILDPKSTQDIESQLKNLGDILAKSPIKIKLDIDNTEFKQLSQTLQSLQAKMGKSIDFNNEITGLQTVTAKYVQMVGKAEKQTEQIREGTNALNQQVKVVDKLDQEGKAVIQTNTTITDNTKKQTAEIQNQIKLLQTRVQLLKQNYWTGDTTQIDNFSSKLNVDNINPTNAKAEIADLKNEYQLIANTMQESHRNNLANLQTEIQLEEQKSSSVIENWKMRLASEEKEGKFASDRIKNQMLENAQLDKQTAELQTQLDLYKQKMLGGDGFSGDLEIFASKQSGKYDKNALAKIKEDVESLNIDTPDLQNKMKQLNIEFSSLGKQAAQSGNIMTRALENMIKFARFYIVGQALVSVVNVFKDGIGYVKQFDDAIVSLTKVVDLSDMELQSMANTAVELGKSLGKSSVSIMEGMAEWGRVTKNPQEIIELTKAATIASNVTSLSVADASKALTTAMITFDLEAKDSMDLVNQWNEIQNNFRSNAEDVAAGISKVGAVAKQSSTPIQNLEGYITSMVSSLGIEGNEAGTALRSVISRIYRIGEDGADDAGKSEEFLKKIGVAVRDTTGQFLPFNKILDATAIAYKDLNNTEQIALAQQLAGTMHYSKLIGLLSNYDIALEATAKAYDSQNSALIENEKYITSISGKIETLKTSLQGFWGNTIDSSLIKGIVDFGTVLVDVLDSGFVRFVATTALLTAALVGAGAGFTALGKSTLGTAVGVFAVDVAEKGLLATTKALWVTLAASPLFWVVAAVASVQALVVVFDALNVSIEEQKEKVEEAKQAYEETTNEIKTLNSELETTQQRIDELNAKDKLEITEEKELEKLQLTNKELELRIALLEKEENIKAKQLANEQTELYNKQYGKYDLSKETINKDKNVGVKFSPLNDKLIYYSEDSNVSALISAYEQVIELKKEATSLDDIDKYNNTLTEIESKLFNNSKELQTTKDILSTLKNPTEEQKEILTEVISALEIINSVLLPEISNQPVPKIDPDAPKVIEDYGKVLEKFRSELDNNESKIKSLNKAMKDLQEGNQLSSDTILQLAKDFSLSSKEIQGLQNGEISVLENKKDTIITTSMASIDAAIKEAEAVRDTSKNNIRNYVSQIDTIEDLAKAKLELAKSAKAEAAAAASKYTDPIDKTRRSVAFTNTYEDYLAKHGGADLEALEQAIKNIEELNKEKDVYTTLLENLGEENDSNGDGGSKYEPSTEQSNIKTLYDSELINANIYLQRLLDLEKKSYSEYANKSVQQIEEMLGSRDEKIAKKTSEFLSLKVEQSSIADQIQKALTDELSISLEAYDSEIKKLNNSISLLGNINTVEEKATETELLGKKFNLATQEITKLEQQLTSPSLTSSMRELISDKIISLKIDVVAFKDSVEDALTELTNLNKSNALAQAEKDYADELAEIEEKIYNGKSQEVWEEASNDRIEALQDRIDKLQEESDELDEQAEREQKLLDIEEARLKLTNLQEQKTVQIYRADANEGMGGFVYEVDQQAVKEAQDSLTDLETDYADWEADLKRQRRITALQEQIDHEKDVQERKRESLEKQQSDLEDSLTDEKDAIETHYADIQGIVAVELDNLKEIYGDKWDAILSVLQDKLAKAKELETSLNNINSDIASSDNNEKATVTYSKNVDYSILLDNLKKQEEVDKNVWNSYVDSRLAKIEDMDISDDLKKKYRRQYKKYDTGGFLYDNTTAINLSGKPEYILNPESTKSFIDFTNLLKKIDITKMFSIKQPMIPSFSGINNGGNSGMIQNYTVNIAKVETPDADSFLTLLPTLVKQYK